ncbi:CLAVATA3/ESR (CLE)-related protein 13 [Humulus lupulus]|uniref:CLAVATA3/ESR (CLE)-related protein 13 n=1 Tax=Humulus lupulus TaxID=3486 RepID=UPI002B40AF39|nr:CLAVATA3/ESR (CLE)-related protein 13 [Humulus lupulus]
MALILKLNYIILSHFFRLILCVSFLFFLIFHVGWFGFNTSNVISSNASTFFPTTTTTTTLDHHHQYYYSSSLSSTSSSNRKLLLSCTKFDFSPFIHRYRRHHARHHHRHLPAEPDPGGGGTQIDPRYGVEKRLVPTGPNPLHH